MNRIYLDYNATTPPHPEVLEKISQWAQVWGNPSSVHQHAREPKALLREAREDIAKLINCSPMEIIFTASGSESNNTILKGIFENLSSQSKKHILIGATEHPSVRHTAESLSLHGAEIEWIAVDQQGQVNLQNFREQLRPDTVFVSMMYANNETGHIYPIQEMCQIAHDKGVVFHTDATQALGKIPLSLKQLGVDYATFSGHKFYALRGVGISFVKKNAPYKSLIHGGNQERARRAGTENLMAIASLGWMAKKADEILNYSEEMKKLRDSMEAQITHELDQVKVIGAKSPRLPNTTNILIHEVDGETLLMNLDIEGISVSTGAACSSGSQEPSSTLLAMGLSRNEAQSSLRISLGWENSKEDIDYFVKVLKNTVNRVRAINS